MKALKILTILMVTVLFALPVGAQESDIDVIVMPASDTNPDGNNVIDTIGSVVQGETDYYYRDIPSVPGVWTDLNWGVPGNSLTLKVITSEGTVLGPYRDSADGVTDGRIYLSFQKGSGNFAAGQWKFEVYGETVAGSQTYTFDVWY
ncbi:MAG: hypothetical protein SCH70_14215 [Candidatus Methanoperedens sp.]|nr:hypothetical protein [Candidatus Methanoperedens sp.]